MADTWLNLFGLLFDFIDISLSFTCLKPFEITELAFTKELFELIEKTLMFEEFPLLLGWLDEA